MIINGINYPEEVIEALKNDRLVIFAGAGVSMGSPTNLPSFRELTKIIAKMSGESCQRGESEDIFLGYLQHKDGVKVHEIAAVKLGDKKLKPNKVHGNIIQLFNGSETIKIVTTNFDLMFEKRLRIDKVKNVKKYTAPALPYGGEFTGVVHLHGSVDSPEFMILTDENFGKAYLLNGYATRFIVDLFKNYTVLFIGYSYNDVMMRYLTRAIPQNEKSKCYILAENTSEDWSAYDLKPIFFEETNYKQLEKSLEILGARIRRRIFDWEIIIRTQFTNIVPKDEESIDELKYALSQEHIIKVLLENVNSEDWMDWLDNNGYFDHLFDKNAHCDSKDQLFISWLVKHFISNGIFKLLLKHDNKINTIFGMYIIDKLVEDDGDPQLLNTYLVLIGVHACNDYMKHMIVKKMVKEEMYLEAWRVFVHYFDYKLIIDRVFIMDAKNPFMIKVILPPGNMMGSSWEILEPHVLHFSRTAIEDGCRIIEEIDEDYMSIQKEIPSDVFSFHHMDIEHSSGFSSEESFVLLSDIICKSICDLGISNRKWCRNWISTSLDSKSVLIKKIALRALRLFDGISDSEKIKLLLRFFDLYDRVYKEQMFLLVGDSYLKCTEKIKECLYTRLTKRKLSKDMNSDQKRIWQYEQYNWLVWMNNKFPNDTKISDKFQEVQHNHMDFAPRDYPEKDFYTLSDEWTEDISAFSREQILQMSSDEIIEQIFLQSEDSFSNEKTRRGLLQEIGKAISQDYDWSIWFFKELITKNINDQDIWTYAIKGMEFFHNDKVLVLSFIKLVSSDCLVKVQSKRLASYILDFVSNNKVVGTITSEQNFLLDVLDKLWIYREDELSDYTDMDFVQTGLNTQAGQIALTWMKLIERIPKEEGIPTRIKIALEKKIVESDILEAISLVVGHSSFLHNRDPEWTSGKILPLLLCQNNRVYVASWEGVLLLTGTYYKDFSTIILEYFFKAKERSNLLEDSVRKKFIRHYTMIMIHSSQDPINKHIPSILKNLKDDDKAQFAIEVNRQLKSFEARGQEDIWTAWLHEYWETRNRNILGAIEKKEASIMLEWVFCVGKYYPDAVTEVEKMCIDIEYNLTRFLYSLENKGVLFDFPEATGRLLIYVIKKSEVPHHIQKKVAGVISKITPYIETKTKNDLMETCRVNGIEL